MSLKDVLQRRGVPLRDDFDERFNLVIAALRKTPDYESRMAAFKRKKTGGADGDPDDFLTPQVQRFLEVITSPAAQGVLRGVFGVVFFVSYLEKLPVFGSLLGATLDLMVAGGKALVKTVQKNLPPVIGLIPLPFMGIIGIAVAAVFGMIFWPILAIVSLSRQDFTAAVESFIRVIPPPIGDTIADLFLEGNRAVARLNAKRIKLAEDISSALELVKGAVGEVAEGATELASQIKTSAKEALPTNIPITIQSPASTPAPAPAPAPAQTAGRYRFSRRQQNKGKWKTRKTRR
jgi:hypothetical protein